MSTHLSGIRVVIVPYSLFVLAFAESAIIPPTVNEVYRWTMEPGTLKLLPKKVTPRATACHAAAYNLVDPVMRVHAVTLLHLALNVIVIVRD